MVISAGILRATGETDTAKAFGKIMGMVVPVSNVMTDFFLFLMRAIVTRNLGEDILIPRSAGTKIASVPEFVQICDPVFYGERRRQNATLEA